MSLLLDPPLVKFFLAVFGQDVPLMSLAIETLGQEFDGGILGQPDIQSDPRPITETAFYEKEMGQGLVKIYLTWPNLLSVERLVDLKLLAMALEKRWARDLDGQARRQVNLDPGYVFAGGLVLSTGKFAGHRLYLGQKIWGELTLFYRKEFVILPWTYPDYQDPSVLALLTKARQDYLSALRNQTKS
ncbi:MAG: DUF4416 family protein [Deltaproteobacteria bacterium]|nr:DUF4416 family protein [Deltaproteobacteria bacterium]